VQRFVFRLFVHVRLGNAMLLAGDANNDNFADISDLLLRIGNYNKQGNV
jgi:hypothetical protein